MSGFINSGSGGGGGGPPTGAAGGDLGSTYPNPTVVSVAHVTTGTLPAANQAAQTMGGDVTGTTAASVVSSISTGLKLHVTSVNHAASPYTALSTEYIIATDSTAGIITVTLPAAPATGVTYQIKDVTGQAATNNVTISGNGANIDNASTFVITVAYASITLVFTGTVWSII
jgi:hypothetical protein